MSYIKPMFIAIEGADGAGTTTQAQLVQDALRPWKVIKTAEPTDGPIGSLIRQMISGRLGSRGDTNHVLALLFAADRQDHLNTRIEPALHAGYSVVTDRYFPSSFVYQNDPYVWLQKTNGKALVPDITFFLDIDHELAAERIALRGEPVDGFDAKVKESCSRYKRVMKLLKPINIIRIDASLPREEITTMIVDLTKRFQEKMDSLIVEADVMYKTYHPNGGQVVGTPSGLYARFGGVEVFADQAVSMFNNKLIALSMLDAQLRKRRRLADMGFIFTYDD